MGASMTRCIWKNSYKTQILSFFDGFPVGETSRSRCNRHSGPTDLKEVFDGPKHGEGQALALRGRGPFCAENVRFP